MELKRALSLYLRSNLNRILAGAAAACIILWFLLFRAQALAISAAAVALYLGLTLLFLLPKRGSTAIVREGEEPRVEKVAARILHYRKVRERISFLRIAGIRERAQFIKEKSLESFDELDRH